MTWGKGLSKYRFDGGFSMSSLSAQWKPTGYWFSLDIELYPWEKTAHVNASGVDRGVLSSQVFRSVRAKSQFESNTENSHKHSPLHGKSAHSVSRTDGSQWSSYPRQLNIQRWFTSRLYRRASHSHPVPVCARGCRSCTAASLRPSNMGYTRESGSLPHVPPRTPCSFIPFSQWQMSCWNHTETANVMWYWPPKT